MKKLVSLLLTLLMVFSAVSPLTAAAAYEVDKIDDPAIDSPLIYIRGAGKNLYKNNIDNDDEIIYPVNFDADGLLDQLKEAFMPITDELIKGLLSEDYTEYVKLVYDIFAPIFEEVVLGKDGNRKDNSGNGAQDPIPNKWSGYRVWDNDYGYDFRLSLIETADDLKSYIDQVKTATHQGDKKISLLGRCLGTNLIAAYLRTETEHALANVDNIILYVPATDGVDFISKLFSGKLDIQADNLDEFADYLMNNKLQLEDQTLVDFITVILEFLEYAKVLGLSMDAFQLLVDRLQGELVPALGLASFLSFPSYWSMVNPEDYEDAKALVFEGKEEEYAGLIAKIDDYHYNVQLGFTDFIEQLKNSGKMKINVIAKYNIPNIPISEASNRLGDFLSSTYQLSYGATCADHGEVLSQSYIDSLEDTRYLSPDLKIDASTCRFPDNTWFMKDSHHDYFPNGGNRLIAEMVNRKGEDLTVWNAQSFPQFTQQVKVDTEEEAVFVPVEGVDSDNGETPESEERFSMFIRFFTAILNFITKLLNGELFS